jgi:hypothetical protein
VIRLKKQYEAPSLEIEEYEIENTLCTSGGCADDLADPIPGDGKSL